MRLLERLLECFRSDARLAPSDLKIMSVARLPMRARSPRSTIGMRSAVRLRSDTERIQNKQTTPILYSNCTQLSVYRDRTMTRDSVFLSRVNKRFLNPERS
jgi:hypothetical protein